MTSYSRSELEKIETRLCMEYDQVREDILAHIHQSDDPQLLALANHIADGVDWSAADLQNDTDIALLRQKTDQMHHIQTALARIKAGTYGICLQCDETIPPERMHALITSEYCLDCQKKREKNSQFNSL